MNDQIVATASTIPDWQGGKEFRVVLPERSFTLGHNDLSIFAIINDTTRTPVLLATENVFRGLQLVVSDGQERILDGRGAEIVIRKDGVRGHVEMMTPIERYGRTGLSLAGWVVEKEEMKVPEFVLIFANGGLKYATRPNVSRPGVDEALGSQTPLNAGFSAEILGPDLHDAKIDVYAVSEDVAWKLNCTGLVGLSRRKQHSNAC